MARSLGSVLWLVVAGCGTGTSSGGGGDVGDDDQNLVCSDQDGDGFGVGADCQGSDCDDANDLVWEEADCDALCSVDPHSAGCACDPKENPEPEVCYAGPAGTEAVPPCRSGLRSCERDAWTSCLGQVLPEEEICNDEDDDCDGLADEDLPVGPCGTCAEDCEESCVGAAEGCAGFDILEEGSNVEPCEGLDPDACVTLGGDSAAKHLIWISNTAEGTISKIDTTTREELGRYYTSDLAVAASASPSRTSVDARGDAVVANRAFGLQPSATRIAADDCKDFDGDGEIRTSSGRGDVLPWGEDECVLWSTPVGGVGKMARAAAVQDRVEIDGVVGEYAWVGIYDEHRYYELDRTDGSLTGAQADCSTCSVYGAAIDRDGNLWSSCLAPRMCRFDTEDPADVEVIAVPCNVYGITVDQDGLVWTASGSPGDTLTSYDPASGDFTQVLGVTGAGVAVDANGDLWTGQCNTIYGYGIGGTCRVDGDTLDFVELTAHSRGIGVDFDGYVWGISLSGYVDVIEPNDMGDEVVTREFNDCGAGGAAGPCLASPYIYSDMTGFQLHQATDPLGTYAHVFTGCPDATVWDVVRFEATVPEGSQIGIEVRSADDLAGLLAAEWIDLGTTPDLESPVSLLEKLGAGPHGHNLEVKFRLLSLDGDARPQLTGMAAQYHCPGGVG